MQTQKELFEQSGWKALNRIGTFAEMHHIFKQNFSDLDTLLTQIKKNEDGKNAWLHLSQYIFNFLASSFSLCEHCRKMMAFYKGTELYKEYEKKTHETFNNNLCAFIHKFRNYQTHYQIEFAYSDTQKNTVVFLSENLLKDKSQWNAESREFILENGDELNVAQIFSDYLMLTDKFYIWLYKELMEYHKHDMKERDALIKKMNFDSVCLSSTITDALNGKKVSG